MFTVITACSNQDNLTKLYDSIDFSKINRWIIVYDTSKRAFDHKFVSNPQILEVSCPNEGKVGNPQRNMGMCLVMEGFMYFLNSDTIIHPNLYNLIPTLDSTKFYTFDQYFFRRDEFRTASDSIFRGDTCAPFKIDGGMCIVPKSLVGKSQWAPDKYTGDGLFIADLYANHPDKHVYIPQVACYYSYLTTSQPPTNVVGGLQNIFFLSREAPPRYPVIDKHYTWIPIHGDISFERLSLLYHKYKPLAYVTYGENNWAALNKLASIRKRWVHLTDLPQEYDITPVVFGAMFGRHKLDKSYPLMSIITTTFHSGTKILRPLRSLQSQSYSDWEWILWDDSKDDTTYKELLELQKTDMRIRVYKAPNHSSYIGEMKRLSASLAQGSFIVEIDHDDDFHPKLLQWILDASIAYPAAGFFYSDCAELTEETYEPAIYSDFFGLGYEMHVNVWSAFHNRYIASYNAAPPNGLTLSHIVGVPNHVRAWRTDFYNTIGRHNPLLSVADDYELILRSYAEGSFCHIRAVGYYQYRNRDGNFTFIRNSLIQHNVKHIYQAYKDTLPPRDYSVPVKEQWRTDAVTHPVTHETYIPPEFRYDISVAFMEPTADSIVAEFTKLKESGKAFHIFVVGELPTISDELKPYVSWWPLKSKDLEERRNYVRRFLHTGGELVFV